MSIRICGPMVAIVVVVLATAACSAEDEVVTEPQVVDSSAVEAVPTTQEDPLSETPVDVTLDSLEVGDDVITFVPASWAVDADGYATPPESSGLSAAVRWRIDDRCLDGCQERPGPDWLAMISAADIDPLLAQSELTVLRDTSALGRRLVEVVSQDGLVTVVIVRWVDGASAYLKCELSGGRTELDDLVPAFEFACDNTRAALAG